MVHLRLHLDHGTGHEVAHLAPLLHIGCLQYYFLLLVDSEVRTLYLIVCADPEVLTVYLHATYFLGLPAEDAQRPVELALLLGVLYRWERLELLFVEDAVLKVEAMETVVALDL